jgi:hypothetical protein
MLSVGGIIRIQKYLVRSPLSAPVTSRAVENIPQLLFGKLIAFFYLWVGHSGATIWVKASGSW